MAQQVGAFLRSRTGEFLTAMEFFNELGLSLARKHGQGLVAPLETHGPTYLLIELATSIPSTALDQIMEDALNSCVEAGSVLDGAIAANETQRAMFWRLREEMPEGQRLEGPQIKHDVAVPVVQLADFVAAASGAVKAILPGVRVSPFGHLGDGNVHFNLSPPENEAGFMGQESVLSDAVYDVAIAHNGSVAAEHGLGQAKIALADRYRPPVERALMRTIKTAVDPLGTMNPGKVV